MLSNQTRAFSRPMLAKAISNPFSGKDWIFETKWENFRGLFGTVNLINLDAEKNRW
jgi:hypothetical protein